MCRRSKPEVTPLNMRSSFIRKSERGVLAVNMVRLAIVGYLFRVEQGYLATTEPCGLERIWRTIYSGLRMNP